MSDEVKTHVISKVFDNLKSISPALITVAIVTGMIIFLPQSIIQTMRLHLISDTWMVVISLLFLSSVALVIVITIINTYNHIITKHKNKLLRKRLENKFHTLSSAQKNILSSLMNADNKYLELNYCDGDVRFLEEHIFITRATTWTQPYSNTEMYFPYIPQPWLTDFYNTNPDVF